MLYMNAVWFVPDIRMFECWAVGVLEHNDDDDDDANIADGDVAGVLLCAVQVMSLVLT